MPRKKHVSPLGPYLFDVELRRDRISSFDEFPFNLPAIRHLNRLEFHSRVTFLVGENGSGKSTLLEALAVACGLNAEGGSRNFRFETRTEEHTLERFLKLSKNPILPDDSFFLRAETFYNVATEIEKLDEGGRDIGRAYSEKKLHEQSHGEGFLALFENRFRGRGLYLLDEPEAALSPTRQLSFLVLLKRLCNAGSQLILATHSPIIMAYPDAWLYVLTERGPERMPYEETEHYRVWRAFLSNHKKVLANLFEGEDELG